MKAGLCSLVVATPLIWLLVNLAPVNATCYFRDVWILRALWPHDLFFFSQFMAENFSEKEQCAFFAANSLSTVYWACVLIVMLTALPVPPKKYRTSSKAQAFAVVSIFLAIYFVFFDGFNDHATGRGALVAYRTTDTIGGLFAKTVFRLAMLYFLIFIWILTAWLSWRSSYED
jgi:phosphate/sulfate permease